MDVSKLEPAERDEKAMRKTALILLIIMFTGAAIIVYKFQKKLSAEAVEKSKGRADKLGELRKNFSFLDEDGKVGTFTDLEGSVSLVGCFSLNQLEDSRYALDALKAAAVHYKDNDEVKLVAISVDSPKEVTPAQLKAYMQEHQLDPDKWMFISAESEEFKGYIKNQLKIGLVIKNPDGKWDLPGKVRMVDKVLRLRGDFAEFDFERYHDAVARAEQKVKEDPHFTDNPVDEAQIKFYSDAVIFQTERMYKSIDYTLNVEKDDYKKVNAKRNSNIYIVPLMVFGGFILFILIMRRRVKAAQAAEAAAVRR